MGAQNQSDDPKPGSGRMAGGADPMRPPDHPSEAFRDAGLKLAELREFAAYYLSARLDVIKTGVRRVGIIVAMCAFGAIAGATVVVMAVVFLLRGVAGAFSSLFPAHLAWLGDLITAGIFLAIPAIVIPIAMTYLTGTFKHLTVKKYESRKRRQREQFGRDVRSEAVAGRSTGKTK